MTLMICRRTVSLSTIAELEKQFLQRCVLKVYVCVRVSL